MVSVILYGFDSACPPLPMNLKVDGKELWGIMMEQAKEPDEIVLNSITRIRG